jgi:hypothetical protein
MASNPKKRQKKLERRSAKRKEKKQLIAREQHAGLAERMSAAAKYPVLDCWITDSVEEGGIGWVVLSRETPNRQVAVATFLVDVYCLGVKDAFVELLGRAEYDNKYPRRMTREMPSRRAPPAEARKLLEQAVAYARGLALPPHPEYPRAMLLFGDVDAADSDAQFVFGKDGKPFFVAGPNDSPERCRQILTTLEKTCGPGNFHYMMPLGGPGPGGGEIRILDSDEELFDEDFDEDER